MPAKRKGLVGPSDPILYKRAAIISPKHITSPQTQEIIEKLLNIAYGEQRDKSKPILVGLAAPQAGISKRIILVDIGADGHGGVSNLQVFINPQITYMSPETKEWYEGCFSTDRVCGIVTRSKRVKIVSYDTLGKKSEHEYVGYVARIFQHEIDHLNGKEFVTHIKRPANLHWVEDEQFPIYRDREAWRTWPYKCSFETWEKIKSL